MSVLVADDKRNLHVVQNTALDHESINQEIAVHSQIHNAVQQSMKEILFEVRNQALSLLTR